MMIMVKQLNDVQKVNAYMNDRQKVLADEVTFYTLAYSVMTEAMGKAKVKFFNNKAQTYLKGKYGVELFEGFSEESRRQHVSYANFVGKNPKECEKVAKETGKAISGVVGAVKKKDKKAPTKKVESKKAPVVETEKDMVQQLVLIRRYCEVKQWDFEALVKLSAQSTKKTLETLIKKEKVAA
jgi:hypothetical protein